MIALLCFWTPVLIGLELYAIMWIEMLAGSKNEEDLWPR